MNKVLLESFENELSALIDKFSGMELTKAEAVGGLEFAKMRIILDTEEEGEDFCRE